MLVRDWTLEKAFPQKKIQGQKKPRILREKKGQKDVAGLMSFLAAKGRTDDIVKAGIDEGFLNKLITDFRSGMLVAE